MSLKFLIGLVCACLFITNCMRMVTGEPQTASRAKAIAARAQPNSLRARMQSMKPGLDRVVPVTAQMIELAPELQRRIEAFEAKLPKPAPLTSEQTQEMDRLEPQARARLEEFRAKLSGFTVDPTLALLSAWGDIVSANPVPPEQLASFAALVVRQAQERLSLDESGYLERNGLMRWLTFVYGFRACAGIDQACVERGNSLLEETARVFGSKLIAIEASAQQATAAEFKGARSLATEHRRHALDTLASLALADEARAEYGLWFGSLMGNAAAGREAGLVGVMVSDFAEPVLLEAYEPELQNRVHTTLKRLAQRAEFASPRMLFAAHAHGDGESALAFLAGIKLAQAQQEQALRDVQERSRASRDTFERATGRAFPAVGALDGMAEEALQLRHCMACLERIVALQGPINELAWTSLADAYAAHLKAGEEMGERVQAKFQASVRSGPANGTPASPSAGQQRLRAAEASWTERVKRVSRVFSLGFSPDKLRELAQPLALGGSDNGYLLERITDLDIRIGLFGVTLLALEDQRASLDVRERARFFESLSARRVYLGLLRALAERGKPGDPERALAVGELARSRQFKDLSGKNARSLEELKDDPQAFAQRVVKRIGAGRTLISYHLLDDSLLTVVANRRGVQARLLRVDVSSIERRARAVHSALASPSGDAVSSARALASDLLDPIATRLDGETQLLFAPDGVLNTVPFEALIQANGQRVVQRFETAYLPSVALFADPPKRPQSSGMFGLADPVYPRSPTFEVQPLPETRDEVNAIARHFPAASELLVGAAATEARLKATNLARFAFVHIATHGVLGQQIPQLAEPALLLGAAPGEDGFLTVSEAQRLKLGAKVAVLSACNTGSGEIYAGEGAMGMSRAFLIAGASAVVVSLWEVPSRETTQLMTAFYDEMSRGLSPAAALREAKLRLALGAETAADHRQRGLRLTTSEAANSGSKSALHPYFWSAFIVMGDASGRRNPANLAL